MPSDWDDLRFLLAVCDAGSATSAARKLSVDKATVVRRVARLEQTLSTRLLIRRASGWSPTPAGRQVAAAARIMSGVVDGMSATLAANSGSTRTTVSITAPHWFCSRLLLPALPKLLDEAPWLDVSVAATSRVLNLAQRVADVAVRNSRPSEGDFVVRRAGQLGSTLFASRAYAKKHAFPDSPESWRELALLGYPDRISYVPALAWLDDIAAHARGITRADDAQAICEGIKAGLGVGVIPCLLGDREPGLVRFGEAVHHETIWLVSPAELATTRAVKLVLAFVALQFRTHAQLLAG